MSQPIIHQDPFSIAHAGIVECLLADDVIREYHEGKQIFLDFISQPEMPTLTNPTIPAKDMPRMSLLSSNAEWNPNNTCTGLLTYDVNIRLAGFHTRSPLLRPLVFLTMRAIRRLSAYLNVLTFEEKPLRTVNNTASAQFEHDDERMLWTVTLPISIQIYI